MGSCLKNSMAQMADLDRVSDDALRIAMIVVGQRKGGDCSCSDTAYSIGILSDVQIACKINTCGV